MPRRWRASGRWSGPARSQLDDGGRGWDGGVGGGLLEGGEDAGVVDRRVEAGSLAGVYAEAGERGRVGAGGDVHRGDAEVELVGEPDDGADDRPGLGVCQQVVAVVGGEFDLGSGDPSQAGEGAAGAAEIVAARAGAQAIDLAAYRRDGTLRLD